MLRTLIEYFAWGLLLAFLISSIVIVHREMRGITRALRPGDHEKPRRRAR